MVKNKRKGLLCILLTLVLAAALPVAAMASEESGEQEAVNVPATYTVQVSACLSGDSVVITISDGTPSVDCLLVTLPGGNTQVLNTVNGEKTQFQLTVGADLQGEWVSYIPGTVGETGVIWYDALGGNFAIPQLETDSDGEDGNDNTANDGTTEEQTPEASQTDSGSCTDISSEEKASDNTETSSAEEASDDGENVDTDADVTAAEGSAGTSDLTEMDTDADEALDSVTEEEVSDDSFSETETDTDAEEDSGEVSGSDNTSSAETEEDSAIEEEETTEQVETEDDTETSTKTKTQKAKTVSTDDTEESEDDSESSSSSRKKSSSGTRSNKSSKGSKGKTGSNSKTETDKETVTEAKSALGIFLLKNSRTLIFSPDEAPEIEGMTYEATWEADNGIRIYLYEEGGAILELSAASDAGNSSSEKETETESTVHSDTAALQFLLIQEENDEESASLLWQQVLELAGEYE